MKKIIIILTMLTGLVAGCAAEKQSVVRIPFPAAEYSVLHTSGSALIHGRVFLETKSGSILTRAGSKVYLNPITSYSNQWYETGRKKLALDDPDPQMLKFVRETTTNEKGYFEFKNIPDGEYFLLTPLVWEDPTMVVVSKPTITRGRFVVRKIHAQEGDNLSVSLYLKTSDYEDKLSTENMPKWSDRPY